MEYRPWEKKITEKNIQTLVIIYCREGGGGGGAEDFLGRSKKYPRWHTRKKLSLDRSSHQNQINIIDKMILLKFYIMFFVL